MNPLAARHRSILFLTPIALLLTLLASCGGNDPRGNRLTGAGIPDTPPLLPLPGLAIQPRIGGYDPAARQAASVVVGQRNMIPYLTRGSESAISMFNGGTWNSIRRGCWSKERGAPPGYGCAYTLQACTGGARFDWTEVIDGECPNGFDTTEYYQWVRFAAATTLDAQQGSFRVYRSTTDTVEEAWAWDLTTEPPGGTWEVYRGEIEPVNLLARLTWTRDEDGSEHAQWVWFGFARWESDVAFDGLTGSLTAHQWSADRSAWQRLHEIQWVVGHGTWKTFDADGAVAADRSW